MELKRASLIKSPKERVYSNGPRKPPHRARKSFAGCIADLTLCALRFVFSFRCLKKKRKPNSECRLTRRARDIGVRGAVVSGVRCFKTDCRRPELPKLALFGFHTYTPVSYCTSESAGSGLLFIPNLLQGPHVPRGHRRGALAPTPSGGAGDRGASVYASAPRGC